MKRFVLVALVAALAVVVAAPAEASTATPQKARVAKKCKKKHGKKKKCKKPVTVTVPAPVVTPPAPPAPLALTNAEVITRVTQRAGAYCLVDQDCFNYGYYATDAAGLVPACSSKTTYSWSCYGWNDTDDSVHQFTCDFREVVQRSGFDGVTSHQDLSYGSFGWICS
jgi:hypothetical protein